jgi:tetratricopeptide (TPR) repeat protein
MKTLRIIFIFFSIFLMSNCKEKLKKTNPEDSVEVTKPNDSTIIGRWIRVSPNGLLSIHFKENGKVETDLGNDNTIEFISNYKVKNDTISFIDAEGASCPEMGVYKFYNRGYTVSFDLVDDLCNGRIKSTMGFWVRTNHNDLMSDLNTIIENSNDIKFVLHRARMNLALGKSKLAQKDFTTYLKKDSLDANVFINRAGTRFPFDLKGVVYDCNKSIALDSTNKNAYFLRGLAFYELGEEQKGCADFQKSIELGFEILKVAEYNKCKEYW